MKFLMQFLRVGSYKKKIIFVLKVSLYRLHLKLNKEPNKTLGMYCIYLFLIDIQTFKKYV
jgi:hypothetical protein